MRRYNIAGQTGYTTTDQGRGVAYRLLRHLGYSHTPALRGWLTSGDGMEGGQHIHTLCIGPSNTEVRRGVNASSVVCRVTSNPEAENG